jgi:hypothetical protein
MERTRANNASGNPLVSTPTTPSPATVRNSAATARVLCVALSLLLLGVTLSAQDGSPFVAGCPPPYTPEPHPVDNDCGIEGDATTDAKKLESRAKNSLCATGSPVWVTFVSFKKLQKAVEKPEFKLESDRSGAKNLHTTNPAGDAIGEGTLVTFAAFVLRADTSNKSGGEDVNCTRNGTPSNDIHVHLGPTKTKSPENFCKAVVAELIPHLRPDAFNAGDLALTNNIPSLAHPVRITGHLLYDSRHGRTCNFQKPANSRASKWEIHPVYKVEVCKHKSLTTCDARDDTKWEDLATWAAAQEDEPDP